MKNRMDTRNRDAKLVRADLEAMGPGPSLLVIVGNHGLRAARTADALAGQWSEIVDLVGFTPRRIVTGCAPSGAEKAARLVARRVTGKLPVVFHRPDLVFGFQKSNVFLNIDLSRWGHALLVLAKGSRPICDNIRQMFNEWDKKFYQVQVT